MSCLRDLRGRWTALVVHTVAAAPSTRRQLGVGEREAGYSTRSARDRRAPSARVCSTRLRPGAMETVSTRRPVTSVVGHGSPLRALSASAQANARAAAWVIAEQGECATEDLHGERALLQSELHAGGDARSRPGSASSGRPRTRSTWAAPTAVMKAVCRLPSACASADRVVSQVTSSGLGAVIRSAMIWAWRTITSSVRLPAEVADGVGDLGQQLRVAAPEDRAGDDGQVGADPRPVGGLHGPGFGGSETQQPSSLLRVLQVSAPPSQAWIAARSAGVPSAGSRSQATCAIRSSAGPPR